MVRWAARPSPASPLGSRIARPRTPWLADPWRADPWRRPGPPRGPLRDDCPPLALGWRTDHAPRGNLVTVQQVSRHIRSVAIGPNRDPGRPLARPADHAGTPPATAQPAARARSLRYPARK